MKFDLSNIEFSKSDLSKKIVLPKEVTPDLAEESGLHIGDGSMNFYGGKGFFQLRGHPIDDKKHYETRIKELYKRLYNLNINIRYMKSTGVIGFQVWSDAIVAFKKMLLGLPVGKKEDMDIPGIIDNEELFFSFMKGLLDTDGTIYIENKRGKLYPRLQIKTISEPLSSSIQFQLNRYGIRTTCYGYEWKKYNWKKIYTLCVNGFCEVNKWVKYVGSNNPKHINKFNLLGLMKIMGPR